MFDDDLIGWQLDDVLDEFRVPMDDVLEGYEVDFAVDGVAIDSCGEPSDPLLDSHTRILLDRQDGLAVLRGHLAKKSDAA